MSEQIPEIPDIQKMSARIDYLERVGRWNLYGLELLASLGELHHNASMEREPSRILTISKDHLKRLLEFDVLGFYLVNEGDSDFFLAEVEPASGKSRILEEVDHQIEGGTFAWALNQNRAIVVKSMQNGQSLIFHALTTKSRVRGMFVGLIDGTTKDLSGALYPLSIAVQNTANALEGAALYKVISDQNRDLEKTVQERTADLVKQTEELKEEIAYRRMAEESLMIAKTEAETAARAKSEFLANMSHEIRTPLNAILGYGEILQYEAKKLGQKEFQEDLLSIDAAGRHLLGLINDILDLSKSQAGKMEMRIEKFKVSDAVKTAVSTCRPLAAKNKNTLEVIYEGTVGEISSDEVRVRQVLLNLLSNACKFTHGGQITLRVGSQTIENMDCVRFQVVDTGIGIRKEKLYDLFQPFTQADSSTTRKYGGTGLGLAISLRICNQLGGDISVASEEGKGSEFTMWIPVDYMGMGMKERTPLKLQTRDRLSVRDDRREENFDDEEDVSLDSPVDERKKVLVIDDDSVVRELVKRFLESEDLNVTVASSGADGLMLAREFQPDVITLDVMMPGTDGWEILTRLKNDPELSSIPVIMLTMVDEKERALKMGADAFLSKPLDWKRLAETIGTFPKRSSFCSILLVEDDEMNRRAMGRILKGEGWTVLPAENSQQALDILETESPSLMIIDIVLPGMDGLDLIANLRTQKQWQGIPIIVVTAKELSFEEQGRLKGVVKKVFQKGYYTRVELIQQVRRLTGPSLVC